jgi:hypothetical protein
MSNCTSRRIWTRVDLAQKQNKGFFSKNREFTKLLIEAVKNDEITTIYSAAPGVPELDSLITKEMFLTKLFKTGSISTCCPGPTSVGGRLALHCWMKLVEFNGVNYISLKDDNTGMNPETDTEFWARMGWS